MNDAEKLEQERLEKERLEQERLALEKAGGGAIVPPALDINTAMYPNTEDIPPTLRGKPIKDGIASIVGATTETEKAKAQLLERERELEEARTAKEHPPGQELSPGEEKARQEKEFVTDPIGFLDRHHQERVRPLAEKYLQDAEETQRLLAAGRIKDYEKHKDKINEYIGKVAPEYRSQRESWDFAAKLARLDDLDKREAELAAREGLHIEEGGGAPPEGGGKKVELSAEEKAAADKFGLSAEEFRKCQSAEYTGD